MTMLEDDDNLTLDKYLARLTDEDKELLEGIPLNVDELVDMDYEELQEMNKLNPNQAPSDEQQKRRLEIITKIMDLHTWAVLERESKQQRSIIITDPVKSNGVTVSTEEPGSKTKIQKLVDQIR